MEKVLVSLFSWIFEKEIQPKLDHFEPRHDNVDRNVNATGSFMVKCTLINHLRGLINVLMA